MTAGGGIDWAYAEVQVPDQIRSIGVFLESMRAHHRTRSRTTNFAWKPVYYWSVDGSSWEGPFDITSAIVADGQDIGAAYTTETEFGLQLRFAIGYRATSGTAVESGTVTCFVVLVAKS